MLDKKSISFVWFHLINFQVCYLLLLVQELMVILKHFFFFFFFFFWVTLRAENFASITYCAIYFCDWGMKRDVFCRINFCSLDILWKKCGICFCDPNVLTNFLTKSKKKDIIYMIIYSSFSWRYLLCKNISTILSFILVMNFSVY